MRDREKILEVSRKYYTPHPIQHDCKVGECVFQGEFPYFVCTKNDHNMYVCEGLTCRHRMDEGGYSVCSVTGYVISDQILEVYNPRNEHKQAPVRGKKTRPGEHVTETVVRAYMDILTTIFETLKNNRQRIVTWQLSRNKDPNIEEVKKVLQDNFDNHLKKCLQYVRSLARMLYEIEHWMVCQKNRKPFTPRQQLFFAISCIAFGRTGKMVKGIFPRIPIFDCCWLKTTMIDALATIYTDFQFSCGSITDYQGSMQIFFNSLPQDEKDAVCKIVKKIPEDILRPDS